MHKTLLKSASAFLMLLAVTIPLQSCKKPIKEPAVSGSFYPSDPVKLWAEVDGYMKSAGNDSGGNLPEGSRLMAMISPHAGYMFSGKVAAHGYARLKATGADTFIVIGPSHYFEFKGASVYTSGAFQTPLGEMEIDTALAKRLIKPGADVNFEPLAFQKEHSIEVQLPFIQAAMGAAGKYRIVPIVIGNLTPRSYEHLSRMLGDELRKNPKAMIIVSSDLSHYHGYQTAVEKDKKVIDALTRLSGRDLQRLIFSGEADMCGGPPAMIALNAARQAGANTAMLYKYANSGDVTSDRSRVVGYASMGIYASPLTEADRREIIGIARTAITEYVLNSKKTGIASANPKLSSHGAAFVTITVGGKLRGCIGHIEPIMPLYESIAQNAVNASANDPRFPPMTPEEVEKMDIEVSILSPLVQLNDFMDIEVGTHGLVMVKDGLSGLILPHVPVKEGWGREEYLKNVSIKAGFPPDAWKSGGAEFFTFTADVVKERG